MIFSAPLAPAPLIAQMPLAVGIARGRAPAPVAIKKFLRYARRDV
jgi:hypothetical protein